MTLTEWTRRLPLTVIGPALATVTLVSCARSDDGTVAAAPPTVMNVKATDYAFSGAPSSIKAGLVRVKLTNMSQKEPHQLVFAKLAPGKTIDDFKSVAASETGDLFAVATDYGGVSASFPGRSASATVVLRQGSYVIFCAIPAPDGQPHVAKGMLAPLTVTAGDDNAIVPDAPETVTGQDFSFALPDGFKGDGAVKFVNNSATQTHELVVFQLAAGKTGDDVLAFFGPDAPPGPPPFIGVSGAGAIHPGGEETFEPSLGPGHYFMACFEGDPATHKPHFMLGMTKEFTVS